MLQRHTRNGHIVKTTIFVMLYAAVLFSQRAFAQDPWATIDNQNVSPRKIAESDSDDYDSAAVGIGTIGVGKAIYLAPKVTPEAQGPISAYTWSVTTEPNPGAAQVEIETDALFKFVPAEGGEYIITLTPLDSTSAATPESTIRLWAAAYLGVDGGPITCALCHGPMAGRFKTERLIRCLQFGVFGLPKVRQYVMKRRHGKAAKKEEAEGAEAVEGAEGAETTESE